MLAVHEAQVALEARDVRVARGVALAVRGRRQLQRLLRARARLLGGARRAALPLGVGDAERGLLGLGPREVGLLQQRLHVRALLLELRAQRTRLGAARLELRLRRAARRLECALRVLQLLLHRRLPLLAGQRLPLELVAQDLVGDGGGLELLPGRVGADALRLGRHADGPRQRRVRRRLALLLPRLRRRRRLLLEGLGRLVRHGERVVPPLHARLLVLLVGRLERRLELLTLLRALCAELVEGRRQHLDLLALGGVGGAERLSLLKDVVVLRAVLLRVLLRVDDRRLHALDRADQLAIHRLLLLNGLAGLNHNLLEHGAPRLR